MNSGRPRGYVFQSGGGGGKEYLRELLDVNLTTPADGAVIVYDSGTQKYIDAELSIAVSLNDLTDVNVDTIYEGQVLTKSGTEYIGTTISTAITLDQLTDVNVATSYTGQVLTMSGSLWVASTAAGGATSYKFVSVTTDYAMDGTEDYIVVNTASNTLALTLPPISSSLKQGIVVEFRNSLISGTVWTREYNIAVVRRYQNAVTDITQCSSVDNSVTISGVTLNSGWFKYVHTGATPIVGITTNTQYLKQSYAATTYTLRSWVAATAGYTTLTIASSEIPAGTHQVQYSTYVIGSSINNDFFIHGDNKFRLYHDGVSSYLPAFSEDPILNNGNELLSSVSLVALNYTSGTLNTTMPISINAPIDLNWRSPYVGTEAAYSIRALSGSAGNSIQNNFSVIHYVQKICEISHLATDVTIATTYIEAVTAGMSIDLYTTTATSTNSVIINKKYNTGLTIAVSNLTSKMTVVFTLNHPQVLVPNQMFIVSQWKPNNQITTACWDNASNLKSHGRGLDQTSGFRNAYSRTEAATSRSHQDYTNISIGAGNAMYLFSVLRWLDKIGVTL